MKLLRSFPALAFALVLLSIAGVCAAQRSIGLLLVAGTLAAISWSVTEGPRGRTLPRWVSNILVIGVCLNVFRDLLQNPSDVMGVLGRFTLLLTLVKLYERRNARDYAQLLMLSLVLMITGCMQSSDLIFGIVLLLYVVLGLYVLLLYQLHAAYERARNARSETMPSGYRLAPPLKPVTGRRLALDFRLLSVAIGIAGVLLSVGVFVTYPRGVGVDLLGNIASPAANRAKGFAWEVNLSTGGRVSRSTARVMSVQFLENDQPIEMNGPVYLRGAVLDRYEGEGVWTSPEARTRRYRMTSGRFERVSLAGIGPGRTIEQRITLTRAMSGEVPLFSMYAPIGMTLDSTADVLYDPRRQALKTTRDTRRIVGYSVRAQPEPSIETQRAITDQITPLGQLGWFRDDDNRVRNLAQRLLSEANLPTRSPNIHRQNRYSNAWDWNRSAARTFEQYLSGGDFTYTLDLSDVRLSGGADPVLEFLFVTRRGHCEYFASALAAMCHSVGIPARVIVGYMAKDYDAAGRQYNVLEGNAHAWVEVATGPHAWMTLDPSPPEGLPNLAESSGTLAETVRSVYSRFEGNWSSQVVGFDTASQERLMDSFSQGWTRRITGTLDAIRDAMERVNIFFNVGPGGYIWMGIVAFALVIAVIALVRLLRRSRAIRRTLHLQHLRGPEYRRMLAQLGFYLDMLWVLDRAGLSKPPWRPPMLHAVAIEDGSPESSRLMREITAIFYEARYGGSLQKVRLEHARAKVRELAASLNVRI